MSNVYVAGSINMDVVAKAERIPLAGETVLGSEIQFFPGGKGANQAVAAARAGAATSMVGRLGNDPFGGELRTFLDASGVGLEFVSQANGASGTALIVVDDAAENSIVVVPGANASLSANHLERLRVEPGDVLISQFETPLETVDEFFALGRVGGATSILNPAPAIECPATLLARATIIVLNESELAFFANTRVRPDTPGREIVVAARKLRAAPEQTIIVTLGMRGAITVGRDRVIVTEGREVEAVDTTGAGDCFVGTLGASLANGRVLDEALEIANVAASLCVQKPGAGPSMPSAEAVREILSHPD